MSQMPPVWPYATQVRGKGGRGRTISAAVANNKKGESVGKISNLGRARDPPKWDPP